MKTGVCIIGGGLVGLMAARVMSEQGRSVKLIEAKPLVNHQPEQLDVRSIALSVSSIQMFNSLGLDAGLLAAMAPITDIHISAAGHFGVTRLHAGDLKLEVMGYVVEYHVLLKHLLAAVNDDSNIEIIAPVHFESLQQQDSSVIISVSGNHQLEQIEAFLVLVADGANSVVRDALQIASTRFDYQQSALIANVVAKQPKQGWAYERFTDNGPLAMLPLTDGRYALVWTNSSQRTQQLMSLSDKDFLHQLHKVFGYRLGFFSGVGQRNRFDLHLIRAQQLVAGRCVLIGNAANALHPVAGQGFNLALRDIGLLYDSLKDIDFSSDQLGDHLQSYLTARTKDQGHTINLGHGLVQLFSNRLPVLNHARAAALAVMDICPLLKQQFSWSAMGYGQGVNSLMRGKP